MSARADRKRRLRELSDADLERLLDDATEPKVRRDIHCEQRDRWRAERQR